MGFMVDEVALGQVFLRALRRFPASVIAPMFQTHSFILLRFAIVNTNPCFKHFNNKSKLHILSSQKYLPDFMCSYDCQTYWDPNIHTTPMT